MYPVSYSCQEVTELSYRYLEEGGEEDERMARRRMVVRMMARRRSRERNYVGDPKKSPKGDPGGPFLSEKGDP